MLTRRSGEQSEMETDGTLMRRSFKPVHLSRSLLASSHPQKNASVPCTSAVSPVALPPRDRAGTPAEGKDREGRGATDGQETGEKGCSFSTGLPFSPGTFTHRIRRWRGAAVALYGKRQRVSGGRMPDAGWRRQRVRCTGRSIWGGRSRLIGAANSGEKSSG